MDIAKKRFFVADYLILFVSFSGDKDDVIFFGYFDGTADGFASIWNNMNIFFIINTAFYIVNNFFWTFVSRIIIGNYDYIGEFFG